ncbi:gfo/Idh/MocA family oxidoreductase, partial [bacterium]|nr:gfo/Idh/MocA family oxidoreductase [bacterium]
GLKHFRQSEKPANASNRCLDCPVEKECPYSACKIYLDRIRNGETGWPADVLTPEVTEESIIQALKEGPYGRCVYRCDNDVVDHQVVNLEFAGNKSATFTMTAFTRGRGRETRIFGTKGEINGDSSKIEIFDFKTDETEVIDTTASEMSVNGGHGGGDFGLMQSFLAAVRNNDSGKILSGPQESLETHLTVFAAERSRHQRTVEEVKL